MKNTNTPKMKWYNYLVYFWLPLNIFFDLLFALFVGRMFDPAMAVLFSPKYEVAPSKGVYLFYLMLLLFLCIFPVVYTIIVRENLRKLTYNAPKLLTFWYAMPVLSNILACQIIFQAGWEHFLCVVALGTLKAAIMIPINNAYFSKRADLFDDHSENDLEK